MSETIAKRTVTALNRYCDHVAGCEQCEDGKVCEAGLALWQEVDALRKHATRPGKETDGRGE